MHLELSNTSINTNAQTCVLLSYLNIIKVIFILHKRVLCQEIYS